MPDLTRIPSFAAGLLRAWARGPDALTRRLAGHAQRSPDHDFVRYGQRRYTYGEADHLVDRHVAAYRELGVAPSDVVALMLENRPEFYWHWLALMRLGAVSALINTNLRGQPLAHAIAISKARHVVVGSECLPRVQEVREQLDGCQVSVDAEPEGPEVTGASFQQRLPEVGAVAPGSARDATDLISYIYTSGTTGLPKAAPIRNQRVEGLGRLVGGAVLGMSPRECMYVCLPLYHSNGLLLGSATAITYGATIALGRRFSARRFWDEVREHGATRFIYIGELCRYLLSTPPSDGDQDHAVRVIMGNGLRADIWRAFQERFGIRRIYEFYGSTEGNVAAINLTGRPGAVGFIPWKAALARWDAARQDFVRDEHGFLVEARSGEPGVLLGRVQDPRYRPYSDQRANEAKIVRNAFEPGDAWFNTGDLLRRRWGTYYFVDRLGDTFRWKGENVSTFEVQEALSATPNIEEVNVYGVHVPGHDGRAGMAAVSPDGNSGPDLGALYERVKGLAPYARPLFVRVLEDMPLTTTHKLKKHDLQEQGFDPTKTEDPLYFLDADNGRYVELTPELYEEIVTGRKRL